ncbi:hypothetical protein AB0I84_18795 [Streptomyces spectabilis]|uniref:hypothetical protein n=1 Tax=Streptomyces spectabilis TaxID=68270 RepID=UPI0033F923A2
MTRLPSLDDYDVQGVRPDEAALWGDDVRWAVEALSDDFPAGLLSSFALDLEALNGLRLRVVLADITVS